MRGWDGAPAPGPPSQAPQGLPLPAHRARPCPGHAGGSRGPKRPPAGWAVSRGLQSPFLPHWNGTRLPRRRRISSRPLDSAQRTRRRTRTPRTRAGAGGLPSPAPPMVRALPGPRPPGGSMPRSGGFRVPATVPGWKLGGGEGLAGGTAVVGVGRGLPGPAAAPVPATPDPWTRTAPRFPRPPPPLRSLATAPRPARRAAADPPPPPQPPPAEGLSLPGTWAGGPRPRGKARAARGSGSPEKQGGTGLSGWTPAGAPVLAPSAPGALKRPQLTYVPATPARRGPPCG